MFYLGNVFKDMKNEIVQGTKSFKDFDSMKEDEEEELEYKSIVKRNDETGNGQSKMKEAMDSLLSIKNVVTLMGVLYIPLAIFSITSYAKMQAITNIIMCIIIALWDIVGLFFLISKKKNYHIIGYLCMVFFFISNMAMSMMF